MSNIAILGMVLALTACTSQALWSVDGPASPNTVTTVTIQRVYGHTESELTIIPPDTDSDGGSHD